MAEVGNGCKRRVGLTHDSASPFYRCLSGGPDNVSRGDTWRIHCSRCRCRFDLDGIKIKRVLPLPRFDWQQWLDVSE